MDDDLKQTELGPLPNDWAVARFRDVVSIGSGQVDPRQSPYSGMLHVGPEDIEGATGRILRPRIAADLGLISGKYHFRPGDILYSKIRPYLRKVALPSFEGVCSADVYPLRSKDGSTESSFLYLWLLSLGFTHQAISFQSRTGIPKINRTQLESTWMPLPPGNEQRTIAQVLLTVQRAKEATEKVVVAGRQVKVSLMRHLFTYGPVPIATADQVELQETEIGLVPRHWRVAELGTAITGTQYGLSQRGEALGRYPILRMNNLHGGRIRTAEIQHVDLVDKEFKKYRLNCGDLLFNRTNSFELVGKTSLFDLDDDYVFASYLIRVVPDLDQLDPAFANYYLNAGTTQARLKFMAMRAVSQSNINATKLRGLRIPLPNLDEQKEIAATLVAADQKVAAEEVRKQALDSLFSTLLHHLMTGKLRVKDLAVPDREADQ